MSTLSIRLGYDSYFLRERTRFEVRNGKMELIGTWDINDAGEIELEPGLYQISAVLSDGRSHERLVSLTEKGAEISFADQREQLAELDIEIESSSVGDDLVLTSPPSVALGLNYKRPLERFRSFPTWAESDQGDGDVQLEELINARGRRVSPNEWVFEPLSEQQIPIARFAVPGYNFEISLPTNPQGSYPLNACTTRLRKPKGRWMVETWIAPERAVASTLQHWLLNGRIPQTQDLAEAATELLYEKYQDPTGALLGALVLFRFGLLEKRQSWLDNLANDFGWLTDAGILKLVTQAREQGPDLALVGQALALAERPVLFTESYSVLINLLRHWPGMKNSDLGFADECDYVLEKLAEKTVNVVWSSTVLTQSEPQRQEVAGYAAS